MDSKATPPYFEIFAAATNDCKSVKDGCDYLKRIISAMKYYQTLDLVNNEENRSEMVSFCDNIYKLLIDNIIRILFGIKFSDINKIKQDKIKCIHCGQMVDEYFLHAFLCRHGKSHIFAHDASNKIIFKLIKSEIFGSRLERRPINNNNNNNNRCREKPDIIIDENISLNINNQCTNSKWFMDTIIYDIYREEHQDLIEEAVFNESGGISIFSAGKLGELEKIKKYKNKFELLRKKNYKFLPIAIESIGGISKSLKKIINYVMNVKANRTGSDKNVLLNNFYVEFGLKYKKIMLKRLYDHIYF